MSNQINEIYIKAFNHAYLLAKYNGILLEKILESKNENEYIKGLMDGKKAYEINLKQDRLLEIDKLRRNKDKDRETER